CTSRTPPPTARRSPSTRRSPRQRSPSVRWRSWPPTREARPVSDTRDSRDSRDGSTAPARTSTLWDRRWRGAPGRPEVWYATFTDRATGTGLWLHGEMVAPTDGSPPTRLGWAALFPPDGPPSWHRTGTTVGAPE